LRRSETVYRRTILSALVGLVLVCSQTLAPLSHSIVVGDSGVDNSYIVDVVDLTDGTILQAHSSPLQPPETRVPAAASSLEDLRGVAAALSEVPAYDWCYGCSATSAAMLFGYYDRNGYPDMYTGSAEGGVCPLNNATAWASGESPLSATHQGFDGLSQRGHVDDYWDSYLSTTDPYYGIWTEHTIGDCTADYMGTNQYHNWQNSDGSTTFYFAIGNGALYDYSTCESGSPARRDGNHGMRLFAESRGYTVEQNFNQYIFGYGGTQAGFTFEQYKSHIDADRPVVIQVQGHTMLGVGYDDPDVVYVHDTWDHSVHSMTWGGTYPYGAQQLQHYGVSVIVLETAAGPPQVSTLSPTAIGETGATLRGNLLSDGTEACEYRFEYGTTPGSYSADTGWGGSVTTGDSFSEAVGSLARGTAYYYVAEARNSHGSAAGSEESFSTLPGAPTDFVATATWSDSVDLSWTAGDGAAKTRIQRKVGGYPDSRTDGTTVYHGAGESVTDDGLDASTDYYYRAWSEAATEDVWSTAYDEAAATTFGPGPTAATNAAMSVEATSATLNGGVADDNSQACQYRFEYDSDSGEPYASLTTWTGSVVTGDPFSEAVSNLSPGTEYFFRAQLQNGTGSGSGAELSFTTLPDAPSGLSASAAGGDAVELVWTPGTGADSTVVVRNPGSYPANRMDGTQVYFDSGTMCVDSGLSEGTTYYYRAWSYHEDSDQWSSASSQDLATTESTGTPAIDVSPASFDVGLTPDSTAEYTLSVSNSGAGTLDYTVGESAPAPAQTLAGGEPTLAAYSCSTIDTWPKQADDATELVVKLRDPGVEPSMATLHDELGFEPATSRNSTPFAVVAVPEGVSVADMAADYLNSGLVEYVEPNYSRSAAWSPDDPMYPLQWNLQQVNAEDAWDTRLGGDSDVVVAVLDSGIAFENYDAYVRAPDLAGVSFLQGYDFINDDAHANDDNGHGTHVCGTLAGATNNGEGVAGLGFGVSIMPVKILDQYGMGSIAAEASGIYYAVNHGADIINLSVCGEGTSQTEADALAYAYGKGVTIVCAAGNDYLTGNDPQYPAAYDDYCIAVGATRFDQTRAPYSNSGGYVDVVAPGGDVGVDQNGDSNPDGVLQQTLDGSVTTFGYKWWEGTSMASPHASAAAALILSENRNWSPDDIRATLQGTAMDLGTAGRDNEFGHGLIDVSAALDALGGAAWLDESPKQGSLGLSGSEDIVLAVDTAGLSDGDYCTDVVVQSNDPAMGTVTVPFTLQVRSIALPTVVTEVATGVEETSATLHGTLVDDGWESCEYRFEYSTTSGGPYEATSWTGSLSDEDPFDETLTPLSEGTVYFVRACARNSAGTGYGDEVTVTTKPVGPTNLTATPDLSYPYYRINLTWTGGAGAAHTVVRGKVGSYPTDAEDGYLVYDGSASECSDSGLDELTAYYYRAWSVADDAQAQPVWSDASAEDSATTGEAPATQPLILDLEVGWNLVSVPLVMPDMSVSTLFPTVQAVYGWDAVARTYTVPDEIHPAMGYWIAMAEAETVILEGTPVETWTEPVGAGWNLIGSAHGGLVDFSQPDDAPDGSVEGMAYRWDASAKSYVFTSSITPGTGYWIAATNEAELSLTVP